MQFKTIAHVKTCYPEKFGVPRQPGLVDEAWGELVFEPDFRITDSVRELGNFSHLWVIFVFHQAIREDWKATVRPPRLGGNEKVGVFASRSPFRPNPIGLSCVKLEHVDLAQDEAPVLRLSGVDLVDGTPILDIKPYIPYADSLAHAQGGFASEMPVKRRVLWEDAVYTELDEATKSLIQNTLALDPRPAYQQDAAGREYGCLIAGWNVKWVADEDAIVISSCHIV